MTKSCSLRKGPILVIFQQERRDAAPIRGCSSFWFQKKRDSAVACSGLAPASAASLAARCCVCVTSTSKEKCRPRPLPVPLKASLSRFRYLPVKRRIQWQAFKAASLAGAEQTSRSLSVQRSSGRTSSDRDLSGHEHSRQHQASRDVAVAHCATSAYWLCAPSMSCSTVLSLSFQTSASRSLATCAVTRTAASAYAIWCRASTQSVHSGSRSTTGGMLTGLPLMMQS